MFAVTIEPLPSVFFLADRPGQGPWKVEEDIDLDLPAGFDLWHEGTPSPEQVVCVSTSDPKHFKVFRYTRDIDPEQFIPTGRSFGGFFSRKAWERFQSNLPTLLAHYTVPDDDPPGAHDEAMRLIRGAR